MKKRVYLETTIPSFYFEKRTEPEMVARREWTIEWWDHHSQNDELVTSLHNLDENKQSIIEQLIKEMAFTD